MKKTILATLGLASLLASNVFASDDWTTTVGTYLETETNQAEYAASNLMIVPALTFGIKNNNLPFYFDATFENRQTEGNSINGYDGNEYRQKYKVGTTLNLGSTTFRPAYEVRVKTYDNYSFDEKSIIENRFHLNFVTPVAESTKLYLNLMPTLVYNNTDADRDGNGVKSSFNDYYQEAEFGVKQKINDKSSFDFGIYNELSYKTGYADDVAATNYLTNEFQARLYYHYRFDNGIQFHPFARIGISKNGYSQDGAGNETKENYRRQRVGMKINYLAENGLNPFAEMYYQNENMGTDKDDKHKVMWKLGMKYSF